jgi:hypothetical protein
MSKSLQNRSVVITGGSGKGISVYGSNTTGTLPGSVYLEGNTVTMGGVCIIHATGDADVSDSHITGSVTFESNKGTMYAFGNTITGSLVCSANDPAPYTSGNTFVGGRPLYQCTG